MNIEQYIREHKAQLDAAALGSSHWSYIERAFSGDSVEQTIGRDRYLLDTEVPSMAVWQGISTRLDASCHASDPLEQFICEHRSDLDAAVPDVRVWEQITRNQAVAATASAPTLKVTWVHRALRVAAAIALLITGAGMGIWYTQYQNNQMAGLRLGDVSAEYAELERVYEQDIAAKQAQLVNFKQVANTADIEADLQQIDQAMNELRVELANVPPANREQVVRAMIGTYKTKLNVLQRVLEDLERIRQTEQQQQVVPDSERTKSI
jgi:hypothetical protein